MSVISGLPMAAGAQIAWRDTSEFFALRGALEQVTGGRDLGLRLGSSPLPHQYAVGSMAALHARSLGDALRRLARYKRLVCPEQVTLEISQGEARLKFECPSSGAEPSGHATERARARVRP